MFLIKFFNSETLLYSACKSGNLELFKYIISFKKIDLDFKSLIFIQLFLQCYKLKYFKVFKINHIFNTIFNFAAKFGNNDIIKYLIQFYNTKYLVVSVFLINS